MTDEYHGNKLRITTDGVRAWTPLALVLVAIGSTDLLFALDSIPATFGVTQVAFLVFAANAFALLGLRALFFVLHNLLDKLVYLAVGLSVILAFIGVKLILTFVHEVVPEVPEGAHGPVAELHHRHVDHHHGREPGQGRQGPHSARAQWLPARASEVG